MKSQKLTKLLPIAKYTVDYEGDKDKPYLLLQEIRYYSRRYKKRITVPTDYRSDGASGAMDIISNAWWVHDWICDGGVWDDGTKVTAWQGSNIIADILDGERRIFRAVYWKYSTFFLGQKLLRKNGLFRL